MIKLNLKAYEEELQMIKDYLEQNVSELLAKKINNGVKITKDNKALINKKDLDGFWEYASEEARKIAKKGAIGKAVKDDTVYGWAIHYFEEDSIEGKLYNEDGTEYKPIITKPAPTPTIKKPEIKKPEKLQTSLFDMLNDNDEEIEEIETSLEEDIEEENIIIDDGNKIDIETGEIIDPIVSFDKETMQLLFSALDGKLEVK